MTTFGKFQLIVTQYLLLQTHVKISADIFIDDNCNEINTTITYNNNAIDKH